MQEPITPAERYAGITADLRMENSLRLPEQAVRGGLAASAIMAVFFFLETVVPRELHYAAACVLLIAASALRPTFVGQSFIRQWPLILIALLSTATTFFITSEIPLDPSSAGKALYYCTSAFVYAALGFMTYSLVRNNSAVFKAICFASLLVALKYLFSYYTDPAIANASRTYIRESLGAGTDLWGPAIALCVVAPKLAFRNSVLPRVIFLPAIVFALIISTGRTGWVWAVLVSALLLLRDARSARTLSWVAVLLVALFLLVLTPIVPEVFNYGSLNWVMDAPIFGESAPIQQSNLSAINEHWRGFETFTAFRWVLSYGMPSILIGTGLSSQVPIGFNFELGNEMRQALPIFHNGFSFLMVRAGLLGILLYATQMAVWIRSLRSAPRSGRAGKSDLFGIGLIFASIFSLPTIAGLYQPGDGKSTVPFIIGYLLAYRYLRRDETQVGVEGEAA